MDIEKFEPTMGVGRIFDVCLNCLITEHYMGPEFISPMSNQLLQAKLGKQAARS